MPYTKKMKAGARKLQSAIRSVPAPLRRKAGTRVLKKAVGKKAAKKTIAAGRAVRRATGIKFV